MQNKAAEQTNPFEVFSNATVPLKPFGIECKLPPGWTSATVGELAVLVQYGSSTKTSEDPQGVPVLRMGNIVNGRLDFNELKYLPSEHIEFPDLLLKPGDVLFNRTNSAELVGKSAVYHGNPAPCSFASYLIRVRLSDQFSPDLLAYYINSSRGRTWIRSVVSQQVGQANVSGTKLRALRVPVPPPNEQHRVVAEIEKHFTRLDVGVASLKRVQASLKRLRASVLKVACEGRLVPTEAELARQEGRSYESASELLIRILEERRAKWELDQMHKYLAASKLPKDEKWKGRYEAAYPAADLHPDNSQLPDGWIGASVQQLGFVQLGRQRAPKHHSGDFMRPYLRVANVYEDRIDASDVLQMNFTPEEFEVFRLEPNDILLNEGQSLELVGRPAIYRGEVPGACFQNTLIRFRPCAGLLPEFALSLFRAYMHSGRFQKIARWTTNIAHLGADRFARMFFPLPPIAEQHRIVVELERRLSVVKALEATVAANLKRAERLRQSILHRAFSGDLRTRS